MSELYLIHHGIEGQKWGIRRFQNPDGSLTPEGLARYGKGNSVVKTNADYRTGERSIKNQHKIEKKSLKDSYRLARKKADDKYTKSGAKWDAKTKGGTIQDRNADADLDKAADEWIESRKNAKTQYKEAKRSLKQQQKNQLNEYYKDAGKAQMEVYAQTTKHGEQVAKGVLKMAGGAAVLAASTKFAKEGNYEASYVLQSIGGLTLGSGLANLANEAFAKKKGYR